MKELPTPTLALFNALSYRPQVRELPKQTREPLPRTKEQPFEVVWAKHQDEVRAAQRLRWRVFADEMGARLSQLPGHPADHDVDQFDQHCEHLLVRTLADDHRPAEVIGTYRVLSPGGARRAGGLYSDSEFDLKTWQSDRARVAELGRSCVHPDHRHGGVILALWSALAGFMDRNGLDTMLGCASISMRDGGHHAASLWMKLRDKHLAPENFRVTPRLPLPVEELEHHLDAEPPALIKGYLRCGAQLLGAPAWDPDFNTADLPMMLRLSDLPASYRKRFLRD